MKNIKQTVQVAVDLAITLEMERLQEIAHLAECLVEGRDGVKYADFQPMYICKFCAEGRHLDTLNKCHNPVCSAARLRKLLTRGDE